VITAMTVTAATTTPTTMITSRWTLHPSDGRRRHVVDQVTADPEHPADREIKVCESLFP
jgi:hypothetical protein